MILASEITKNQNVMKGLCLESDLDLYFNSLTIDNVDLCSSVTVWFFQILGHFLWLWDAGIKFIQLLIILLVK